MSVDTGLSPGWTSKACSSRGSIWLSNWISSTAILRLLQCLVPLAITTGVVVALYGSVSLSVLALILVGMVAAIAFFAAVGLAAGTVVPGQPAIVAIGLGILFLVPVVAGLAAGRRHAVPADLDPRLDDRAGRGVGTWGSSPRSPGVIGTWWRSSSSPSGGWNGIEL